MRLTVTLWILLPLVPLTVRVELPLGVDVVVVTVKVELPAPVIEPGLKLAVAPDGRPVTVRPILPAKPLIAVVLMVYVTVPPRWVVRDDGDDEMVKSCDAR